MKKTPYLIFLLLIALGCENESNLTFEPLELQGENCKDCPTIEINVPKAWMIPLWPKPSIGPWKRK